MEPVPNRAPNSRKNFKLEAHQYENGTWDAWQSGTGAMTQNPTNSKKAALRQARKKAESIGFPTPKRKGRK